jgi:CheY-like chemotaxis protein
MTRGKISLELRPTDIADVVAAGIELASPLLEQRSHRLAVRVPRGLVVNGDPTRLGQVFANLLTNAAKYTPAGGSIVVAAQAVGRMVEVRVQDTGMGIRTEMLPRIFDIFVQERQSLDRADGGLGLGLAIVRSLVGLHGGRVEARSEGPGRGSELIVELPLAEDSTATAAAQRRPATSPRRDGWRVLVVDDNVDAADLLAEALESWGHAVSVAHDAVAALKLLEGLRPELMLLDIGLPVMDGYELARRIRADPVNATARLVAVTGYGQPKDRAASAAAGFDAHLVKPVDLETLEAELSRVMAAPARAPATT